MSVAIAQSLRGWNAPVFNGQPHEDARMWISNIRIGLKLRRVPQTHWVGIALRFMGEEPRAVLVDVKRRLDPDRVWDWETFTRVLVHIHDRVKKEAENADNIGGSAENESGYLPKTSVGCLY
ncbi:hypothetical protein B0H10DRAFT_2022830 [Mycena sp. CBHHK59/15]|nr:hypothetical protein B0H10DRAFT_2022830 [Mycena sp. CBHHK59/15]